MPPQSLVPSSDNTPSIARSSIPSHLSEATFRRYETYLEMAVLRFPESTCFELGENNVAPTTFAARLRDSIASLLRYKWMTVVDVEKLWRIAGKYVVAHEKDGSVWFRGKERQGRPTHLTPEAKERALAREETTPIAPSFALWEGGDLEQLTALCVLIHHQRITAPVHMDFCPELETTLSLTSNYNVSIFRDPVLNKTIVQ